jgi:hypothetical protein
MPSWSAGSSSTVLTHTLDRQQFVSRNDGLAHELVFEKVFIPALEFQLANSGIDFTNQRRQRERGREREGHGDGSTGSE